jgi:hypothetical protein
MTTSTTSLTAKHERIKLDSLNFLCAKKKISIPGSTPGWLTINLKPSKPLSILPLVFILLHGFNALRRLLSHLKNDSNGLNYPLHCASDC